MIESFNKMIEGPEGSDEKIQNFLKTKKKLHEEIINLNKNTKSNIKFDIINGYAENLEIKHKYTDISLKENNLTLLKISLMNILAPINARSLYNKYYEDKELKVKKSEIERTKNFLKKIFELDEFKSQSFKMIKEERFRFVEEKEEERETKGTKILYSHSIFQPSYELLKEITEKIELIDKIEFEIISNQVVDERNEKIKVILPTGKGDRVEDRDAHLPPTKRNLIRNIYQQDDQEYTLNIKMTFKMVRELNFQEEIIIKNILRRNGIYVKKTEKENPQSITDFDFLMILSNLKVNI